MKADFYTKAVLTVIAGALLYLCVAFTPLPTVHAQRGLRPGDDTGPAQVVIVGWRTSDRAPVQLAESVPLKMTGDVTVNGLVQVEQPPNKVARVVLAGWEEEAVAVTRGQSAPGTFRALNSRAERPTLRGVPVTAYAPW